MAKSRMVICPYCGETQSAGEQCRACGGLFDALSRQATHNDMGPWYIRSQGRPHQPGCSYETLIKLVERGIVNKHTVLRGPTTKQFWTIAKRVPGVAHVLGFCHQCDAEVDPADHGCHACGVAFGAYLDRNYLGLPEVRPLPWEAPDAAGASAAEEAFERDRRWSHAGANVGVSSFASDAELMGVSGGASHAGMSGGVVGGTAVLAARTSAPATFVETAQAPVALHADAEPGTAAVRAMQRRMLDMQRTMRMLLIGLAVVCIVAVLLIIRLMVEGGGPGESAAGAGNKTGATGDSSPFDASSDEDTNAASTSPDAPVEEAPDAGFNSASASSNRDQAPMLLPPDAEAGQGEVTRPVPPTAQAEADAQASMAEARTLFERARDDASRPIDDRIRDAEQAARLLKSINAGVLAEANRGEHSRLAAEVDRLVEKLKLQKFFP